MHAAGDSIKVPEAATEAASNVTAAVRKAGEYPESVSNKDSDNTSCLGSLSRHQVLLLLLLSTQCWHHIVHDNDA